MKKSQNLPHWYSVRVAAEVLGDRPDALRKRLQRNARRAPDGGIEAEIDGVRGRKFGHSWRVSFSERWSA